MIYRLIYAVLLFAFCLILLSGCTGERGSDSGEPADSAAEKPVIAVTIVPEETFVKAVCGDMAEVITMVPPGYNPENYEPAPAEMELLSNAALYFSIGVPVEESYILENVGDVKVISLHEEVALVYPERTFDSGDRDAHIWLSPKRVKAMVQIIAREMSELDPDNASFYSANAEAYILELDELDWKIKSALENIQNRKFIVFHPAFGYFADDYGLQMYALEEDGKEATAQHLQDMIDLAEAENIKVIFYQEEIDSSQSQAFAEEIGGNTMQLSPLAADYIDSYLRMVQLMAEVMQ